MTRINSNLPPSSLHRLHLIAEYREITMVPAALRRSLRTKSIDSVLRRIPGKFTLNSGHVMFFYDKLGFLKRRFDMLVEEMTSRGYTSDLFRKEAFDGFPQEFYNDWTASSEDNAIVKQRIDMRISEKPHLYT